MHPTCFAEFVILQQKAACTSRTSMSARVSVKPHLVLLMAEQSNDENLLLNDTSEALFSTV